VILDDEAFVSFATGITPTDAIVAERATKTKVKTQQLEHEKVV
jgi:hypothetical protein